MLYIAKIITEAYITAQNRPFPQLCKNQRNIKTHTQDSLT